jgi:small subunit ribosomal protein S8
MSMTDPIADMLTRIRNAVGSKHRRVDMPASKMKTEIARLLKQTTSSPTTATLETEEGQQGAARHPQVRRRQPVIRELQARLVAWPAEVRRRRRDSARAQRPRVAILSTSKGLMSDARRARRAPAVSCSPSSGKEPTMSRIGKHARERPGRGHGEDSKGTV